MVRAFAHGAIGRRIDPSWWTHCAISRSSPCSTTGVTKAVRYWLDPLPTSPLADDMVHIKDPMLLIEKSSPGSSDSGFQLSLSEMSDAI